MPRGLDLGNVGVDMVARQEQLASLEDNAFEELDQRYYDLESAQNLHDWMHLLAKRAR